MHNPFTLFNKKILITGASSGIGKTIAIECAKMGAQLIITGRNKERLNKTFTSLEKGTHSQFIADFDNAQDKQELLNNLPNLDGIVHSAGIAGHKPFQFIKKEDFNQMFNINFFAPSQITIDLLKIKKINNGASIVFITSIAGILTSYYGGSLYSSTKGALNGMIK